MFICLQCNLPLYGIIVLLHSKYLLKITLSLLLGYYLEFLYMNFVSIEYRHIDEEILQMLHRRLKHLFIKLKYILVRQKKYFSYILYAWMIL